MKGTTAGGVKMTRSSDKGAEIWQCTARCHNRKVPPMHPQGGCHRFQGWFKWGDIKGKTAGGVKMARSSDEGAEIW